MIFATTELVKSLEESLSVVVGILEFLFETVAVICVAIGLISAGWMMLKSLKRRRFQYLTLRIQLGTWLALALEFQLGADILETTIAPTFEALGKLGAIAAIRTFLNVFLQQELETEEEARKKRQQEGASTVKRD